MKKRLVSALFHIVKERLTCYSIFVIKNYISLFLLSTIPCLGIEMVRK
jgi:hypothetical protein